MGSNKKMKINITIRFCLCVTNRNLSFLSFIAVASVGVYVWLLFHLTALTSSQIEKHNERKCGLARWKAVLSFLHSVPARFPMHQECNSHSKGGFWNKDAKWILVLNYLHREHLSPGIVFPTRERLCSWSSQGQHCPRSHSHSPAGVSLIATPSSVIFLFCFFVPILSSKV